VLKGSKTGVACVLALGLCAPWLLADEITPEAQKKLIVEGAMLHDKGDFDAALAKYREVLAANPSNTEALYETTLTLSAKQDWKRCYEMAEGALAADSPYKALFYTTAGPVRKARPLEAVFMAHVGVVFGRRSGPFKGQTAMARTRRPCLRGNGGERRPAELGYALVPR